MSYHEVRLLHHVERVPVDDLSGDPAAVDEGLDGPAGLDTERRDGEAGVEWLVAHLMASWVQVLLGM